MRVAIAASLGNVATSRMMVEYRAFGCFRTAIYTADAWRAAIGSALHLRWVAAQEVERHLTSDLGPEARSSQCAGPRAGKVTDFAAPAARRPAVPARPALLAS